MSKTYNDIKVKTIPAAFEAQESRPPATCDELVESFSQSGLHREVSETLALFLTTSRRHLSYGEKKARTAIRQWAESRGLTTTTDKIGNIIIDTRTTAKHTTLFSCHTDTVHRIIPDYGNHSNPVELLHDGNVRAADGASCLGSDDAAGVAVLQTLLIAQYPALYIFHVGEEVGGLGSEYIAESTPELLSGIMHAIAFDRMGRSDVIWVQGGDQCASIGCTTALAAALNTVDKTFTYRPDDTGSFTDTKNYYELIPECFNIACGYTSAHTRHELLDLGHLAKLCNAATQIDWDSLPVLRVPYRQRKDWQWDTLKS